MIDLSLFPFLPVTKLRGSKWQVLRRFNGKDKDGWQSCLCSRIGYARVCMCVCVYVYVSVYVVCSAAEVERRVGGGGKGKDKTRNRCLQNPERTFFLSCLLTDAGTEGILV